MFKVGDKVRIKSGQNTGKEGVVTEIKPNGSVVVEPLVEKMAKGGNIKKQIEEISSSLDKSVEGQIKSFDGADMLILVASTGDTEINTKQITDFFLFINFEIQSTFNYEKHSIPIRSIQKSKSITCNSNCFLFSPVWNPCREYPNTHVRVFTVEFILSMFTLASFISNNGYTTNQRTQSKTRYCLIYLVTIASQFILSNNRF